VAGYLGVIDERIDLALVEQMATLLPHWDIRMVGPVAKIAEADLPRIGNISWQGQRPYPELPRILAGWDVALMPFALNEATRSISPTKTPEYLAAGLDVVSTAVPDVVRDYGGIIHVASGPHAFAGACESILRGRPSRPTDEIDRLLEGRGWGRIAAGMAGVIREEEAGGSDIAVESL
jgi:UDP-galactopyranose mutase